MKAMVLAAGLGTRLRPLTETTPKPLVDVCGRPMIAYALDLVRSVGIVDVAINLHHLGDHIRAALGDGSDYGLRLHYFDEDPILDTGGGIANARALLGGERFVVLNSDTITDIDLAAMLDLHESRRATATMLLRPDPEAERYGVIEVDAQQRVRRFLGRPAPGLDADEASRLTSLMFGGVHIFEPRVFDYMETGVFSITRETYPRMLAAGEPIVGYIHHGFWRVLDTPEGLAAGRDAVRRHLSK